MTHTRRFGQAVKKVYLRFFRKKLCEDCQNKLDKGFGLSHRIRHHIKRRRGFRQTYPKPNFGKRGKLRQGIHHVRINGIMRKVKVLSNGRWRFMKGR